MNEFPIIDLFASIQGEGCRAGIPSIFIRTSGCNLRCVFGNSICDTPYSSYKAEGSKYTWDNVVNMIIDNPQISDIVITGGEPLMRKLGLIDMLNYISEKIDISCMNITVETNGTFSPIQPEEEGAGWTIDLYSVSPKLSTAVAKVDQKVTLPDGTEVVFDKDKVDSLNKTRKNIPVLKEFVDAFGYQFKFVYSGPASYQEILKYVEELGVEPQNVMLMPEGMTEEVLQKHRKEAADICIHEGWNYTDRLHITIWGDKRGY